MTTRLRCCALSEFCTNRDMKFRVRKGECDGWGRDMGKSKERGKEGRRKRERYSERERERKKEKEREIEDLASKLEKGSEDLQKDVRKQFSRGINCQKRLKSERSLHSKRKGHSKMEIPSPSTWNHCPFQLDEAPIGNRRGAPFQT